jgi:POT family proton-dependent oligopeptide transporter
MSKEGLKQQTQQTQQENNQKRNQNHFPKSVKYILGNELSERFSYYGMQVILVVFMTQYLMRPAAEAKSTFHFFIAMVYFCPLLGGYIADRWWGKYKTILYLSLVYCVGHLVLALWESYETLLVGLFLIALGAGGIKPCVAAYIGDQLNENHQSLRGKIYSMFYFAINFGGLFSTLLTPYLLEKAGPAWAFGVPGILMAVATFIFWLGRHQYINVLPSQDKSKSNAFRVWLTTIRLAIRSAIRLRHLKKAGDTFFDAALSQHSKEEVLTAKIYWQIIKVFLVVAFFFSLFEQRGSSWVLQASQMDLVVLGWQVYPSQLQALNPIFVLLLIPFCQWIVYPWIERMGYRFTLLRKMGWGMILTISSFVCVGVFQILLNQGNHLSVAWQIVPYFLITLSEVLVSISGLEFAYEQAPEKAKSTIMGFWYVSIAVGNLFTSIMSYLNIFSGAGEFFFYALLMLVVSFVFIWVAKSYRQPALAQNTDN